MLIYFQITILEKQLKSLTERIRLFNTLKFQRGWNGVTKSRYSQKTQGTKQQAIQKTPLVFMIYLPLIKVDLGRIELPSKRGNHMLSTCLSLPKIFEHKQDQSHQLMPYPLKFRKSYEEKLKLFPILLCHFIKRFGTRAFE